MPSGSKRRKAAKKKKEQEATNNNNASSTNNNSDTNTLGNDDSRSQDERESDVGEVGSPASQDHNNHQNPFKEGTEESEKGDPLPVRSFDTENKSMEEVAYNTEGAKKIEIEDVGASTTERELKSEEDSESQSMSVKHIRFVKESHDGSSSSSSSSDDESQEVEKKPEEAVYDSVSGAISLNRENKPVDCLPEEVIQVMEKAPVEEVAHKSILEATSRNGENKPVNYLPEEVQGTEKASLVEVAYDSISEAISHNGENKWADSLSEEVIQVVEKVSIGGVDNSIVDSFTIGDSVQPLVTVTEDVVSTAQSDPIENSVAPDVVESGLKESEESKRNEDKVFPISDDSVGAPSTVVESAVNGNEGKVLRTSDAPNADKVLPTSDAPDAETSNVAENIRDSKIPDSSESQPLIACAPRATERTSWMSCCGLLDVLTGSSR